MFKVGQLVTAKEYNSYAVTDKGKPCEVIEIGQSRIKVKCLWGEEEKFWVYPDKFRPMSEWEILKPGQKVIIETLRKVRGKPNTEIVTFLGYRTYGMGVRVSEDNCMTLTMNSLKGVVRGGLHV